ncbi:hypothetical protein X798_07633 [Onchocerca flexuosa]|uniref:Uncharacterized protein n=2 Tax=Onchocerca flexuosa TaxID=387005 RepID=A0A183HGK9_9BILA|nr:hypothetical protein X798_07633 [Onchocerca flexuosa]VDO47196.1 unnamed protein product [Onchocerca flexuosa]
MEDLNFQMYLETLAEKITQLLKMMPTACGFCLFKELENERKCNAISHFILRLAFCQTSEQKKRFIQQERSRGCFHMNKYSYGLSIIGHHKNWFGIHCAVLIAY